MPQLQHLGLFLIVQLANGSNWAAILSKLPGGHGEGLMKVQPYVHDGRKILRQLGSEPEEQAQ